MAPLIPDFILDSLEYNQCILTQRRFVSPFRRERPYTTLRRINETIFRKVESRPMDILVKSGSAACQFFAQLVRNSITLSYKVYNFIGTP